MSLRAARAARRLRVTLLRSLSTSTEVQSGSKPSQPDERPKPWHPQENLRSLHPRMIFVRPWDGIPSMAHAFAIIRGVERRFGKIQEFVVLRDSDVWTNNLPYMHATFARAEYTDAIPLEGRVIQVPIPATDPARAGGVGLDDLESYLDPETRARDLSENETDANEGGKQFGEGPQAGIMMDVKLERTGMRDAPLALDFILGGKRHLEGPPLLRNILRAREIANAMLSFGGFAPPKEPGDPTRRRTRMQMVLERWRPLADKDSSTESQQPRPSSKPAVEPKSVQWMPFERDGDGPSSEEPLPPPTMATGTEPSTSPPPPTPATPSKVDTPSQPPSSPVKPTPTSAPTITKKERMLLAARMAGAKAASQPAANDYGNLDDPTPGASASTSDKGSAEADVSAEFAPESDLEDTMKRDDANKRAASRWWEFLTSGR